MNDDKERGGIASDTPRKGGRTVPSFHLLVKPTGARCNLGCKYCFFLEKDKLYPGSDQRMDEALLELYLSQLFGSHRTQEVTVAWQGGEPTLMGLDFFERSLELERKYARPGMSVVNTIQTNGTLIDDDWARFFKRNRFLVGLSLDGPRELHDAYRVDKAGLPSFDRVMRAVDRLNQHEVEWNALTTINRANQGRPEEVYRFLRDRCQARFVQYIPIVERSCQAGVPFGDQVTDRSVTPEGFGTFMARTFEEWARADIGSVYVQMFDVALANWYGEPSGLCVHSPTCGTALVLEHNGDLYSCDHFVQPDHLLGNIKRSCLADLVASDQQWRFGMDKRDRLPLQCQGCEVRFACHGGCPKDRFISLPGDRHSLNYLCPGYKMFFHHIDRPMRAMCDLLMQGRAPAEYMWMDRRH